MRKFTSGVSFPPGKQVNIAPSGGNQYKWVCLLVSSQIGARDISHTMFNAPGGVNFALVNPVTYQSTPAYSVLLRVSSAGLQELWHWLLTDSLETLISSGLTGLAVSGGAFLWLTDPDAFAQGWLHYYWVLALAREARHPCTASNSIHFRWL